MTKRSPKESWRHSTGVKRRKVREGEGRQRGGGVGEKEGKGEWRGVGGDQNTTLRSWAA